MTKMEINPLQLCEELMDVAKRAAGIKLKQILEELALNQKIESVALQTALAKLIFAARTSGGIAGKDETLCQACDYAEAVIQKATP